MDDFKSAIDIKFQQWRNDPKMVGCLRPGTLFAFDKFESYVQEARLKKGRSPKNKPILNNLDLMALGLDVLTKFGEEKFIEFCDLNNLSRNDIKSIRNKARAASASERSI